ncbi:MAG: ribosome assembly protein YihI (activator of Der GTPase) [Colwellia sp.]|jgi:ribosome assembly protein YihI (activator of Der GTPase)
MSRNKKSRKQGTGSIGAVKDDKKKVIVPVERKPKKKTGKQAGNRQKEAFDAGKESQTPAENKDPRIGSKKLIDLGTPIKAAIQPFKAKNKGKADTSPITAIRVVEPDTSLEQELFAIEEDTRLQSILAQQDEDISLSNEDVDYFNEKMERHQQLRELLGLEDEDEDESSVTTSKAKSGDDLWDKFDNSDLSEFE